MNYGQEVTDPNLLSQLNSQDSLSGYGPEVTDPTLLKELKGQSDTPATPQNIPESVARGFVRNFPLAQQALAATASFNPWDDKNNYSDEMAHLTQKADEAHSNNPTSYDTGAVAGSLAPLAIPGIGSALEAAPVGATAALNAIQGASDTDFKHPTGQDLENIGTAGVVGGALGGAGKLLGKVFPSLNPMTDMEIANKGAMASSDMGKFNLKELENLSKKYAPVIADMGEGQKNDLVKIALGKNLNSVMDSMGTPIKWNEGIGSVIEKTENALTRLGQQQSDLIKNLKVAPEGLSSDVYSTALKGYWKSVLDGFEKDAAEAWAQNPRAQLPFDELTPKNTARAVFQKAKQISADIEDALISKSPNLAKAQKLKEYFSDFIRNYSNDKELQGPFMMARTAIRNGMTEVAPPELKQILLKESMLHDSLDAFKSKAESTFGGSPLKSYYSTPVSIMAFLAGHAVGGWPMGMAAGLGTAAATNSYGPQLTKALYDNPALVKALPTLGKTIRVGLANGLSSMFKPKEQ